MVTGVSKHKNPFPPSEGTRLLRVQSLK
uniref:Uncharacterized protein n=1 Tax=Rhizophora mucronata TaxID=61149 RepID=A0A2P2QSI9_RHIMU